MLFGIGLGAAAAIAVLATAIARARIQRRSGAAARRARQRGVLAELDPVLALLVDRHGEALRLGPGSPFHESYMPVRRKIREQFGSSIGIQFDREIGYFLNRPATVVPATAALRERAQRGRALLVEVIDGRISRAPAGPNVVRLRAAASFAARVRATAVPPSSSARVVDPVAPRTPGAGDARDGWSPPCGGPERPARFERGRARQIGRPRRIASTAWRRWQPR